MSKNCIYKCKGFKHLYAFPVKEPKYMDIWCSNLNLDRNKISTQLRICDKHFDDKFIGKQKLKMGAIPIKSTAVAEIPALPKSRNRLTEVPKTDSSAFETIYITLDGPPNRRSYERKAKMENKCPERNISDANEFQTVDESTKLKENVTASKISSKLGFEPVKLSFDSPPKRTYAHGVTTKNPQLDMSMTCYCRCHRGEEEERKQLLNSLEALKKKEEEQSREIQLLMSQNKISEHLLKTKTKRIADLVSLEESLRKELDSLKQRLTDLTRSQIKAAVNASENGITFARMVCDKRKKYTRAEVLLAQKIYSISARCYNFMRGVLMLNLPHTTTLMRQRQLKAISYVEQTLDLEPDITYDADG